MFYLTHHMFLINHCCWYVTHHTKPSFLGLSVNFIAHYRNTFSTFPARGPLPEGAPLPYSGCCLRRSTCAEGRQDQPDPVCGMCSAFPIVEVHIEHILLISTHPGPLPLRQGQSRVGDQSLFSAQTCPLHPHTFTGGDNRPWERPRGTPQRHLSLKISTHRRRTYTCSLTAGSSNSVNSGISV